MGSVQVKYRPSRGSSEAGALVTDAKEFFEQIIEQDRMYDHLKGCYDSFDE